MFYDVHYETMIALQAAFPAATLGHQEDIFTSVVARSTGFAPPTSDPPNSLDFYPNQITVTRNTDDGVTVVWKAHNPMNPHKPFILDQCDLHTSEDIAGWVSLTKTEMLKFGINTLRPIFNGTEIMPKGEAPAVELAVQGCRIFNYCGCSYESMLVHMTTALRDSYQGKWVKSGNKILLALEGAGGSGTLVAREEGVVASGEVKWRLILPMKAGVTEDKRGQGRLIAGQSLETFLVTRLVDGVLGYLVTTTKAQRQISASWKPQR